MSSEANRKGGAAKPPAVGTGAGTDLGIVRESWLKPRAHFRIRKILVPVDFSEPSQKAAQYALALAEDYGAELVLLHVVEPYPLLPEMPAASAELQAMAEKAAGARLKKLVKSAAAVPCLGQVRVGHAARTIVEEAKVQGADLIVASTHGRTGLARAALGSVAEQVVRRADCPVLVVREQEREIVVVDPDDPGLNRIGRVEKRKKAGKEKS